MPTLTPTKLGDKQARRLIGLYEQASRDLTASIQRAIARGNETRYLTEARAKVEAALRDLRAGSKAWVEQTVPQLYRQGMQLAVPGAVQSVVEAAGAAPITLTGLFGGVHEEAMLVLADNAYGVLDSAIASVGRQVDDTLRRIALDATLQQASGAQTAAQSARTIAADLIDKGLVFDKAGALTVNTGKRDWKLPDYADMVSRTTARETLQAGSFLRMAENGIDLVMLMGRTNTDDGWGSAVGKVASITGADGYPSVDEIKERYDVGHPRCVHVFAAATNDAIREQRSE